MIVALSNTVNGSSNFGLGCYVVGVYVFSVASVSSVVSVGSEFASDYSVSVVVGSSIYG